ncbi:intracellular protein transport protein [Malassezia pachydermatis]|uniref:Arm repeat-containing protein n=1 Tax=Malassezia pachydermatis TaxID=77020 RepID=A0A0M8MVC8_9BASI|nr:arm repeat-containing protein [Malassezia pachydermatis]KOS15074.1 arm repeat-containing protein [Malassezia pachydermatis]
MSRLAFSPSALLDVLATTAQASNASTLQMADAQLADWEEEYTLWEALLQIALDPSVVASTTILPALHQTVRQLAIIRFKNGIGKFWRARIIKQKKVVIPPEAKDRIRTRLMDILSEPEHSIAVHGALIIARIARLDYPDEWPDLVTKLQEAIMASIEAIHQAAAQSTLAHTARETTILLHACNVLRQCLKEFESVRLLAGRMRMTNLARTLLPSLQPAFLTLFQDTFETQDPVSWANQPGVWERIRASHLMLKVLHRLVRCDNGILASKVSSVDRPNLAYAFFECTPSQVTCILQRRTDLLTSAPSVIPALTKHMVGYVKLHLDMVAKMHSHVASWAVWPEVTQWYWTMLCAAAQEGGAFTRDDDENEAVYPYRWLVLALSLVRLTLGIWKRNRPAGTMFAGLPGAQFELQAVDVLLGTYMRLTQADLEQWQEVPETFAMEEAQNDTDVDIRPTAERLLLVLTQTSRRSGFDGAHTIPSVAEYVWAKYEETAQWPATLEAVLAREAVYTALGICRDQLDGEIAEEGGHPSDRMAATIRDRLIPEAKMEADPIWLIVRRRIARLLWEWSEYVQTDTRTMAYALLVDLLREAPGRTDAAVQLAAAKTLAAIMDSVDFSEKLFEPYLGEALMALVHMLADQLTEMDNIRTTATTLAILIERVGALIDPYTAGLLDMIARLWALPDPETRSKPSVLECLDKLVCASSERLRDNPLLEHVHTLVARLVRSCLEPELSPLIGYDGLLLWAHALQYTPQLTAPLFALAELAPSLVTQPDFAPVVCQIWEDCALLASKDLLHVSGPFYQALTQIVADPESPIMMSPLRAIATHLRCLDEEGLQVLADLLTSTELGVAIVQGLRREEDFALGSHYALVAARMAFALPPHRYLDMVKVASVKANAPIQGELVLTMLKWARMSPLLRVQKLVALALAQSIRYMTPEDLGVAGTIHEVMSYWMDVLGEVVEDEQGNSAVYEREDSPDREYEMGDADEIVLANNLAVEFAIDTSRNMRVEAMRRRDPIETVPLRAFIAEALNTALANTEGTQAGEIVRSHVQHADPLILETLHADLRQRPASSTSGMMYQR